VALLDLRERVEHAAAALLQDGLLEYRLGLARLDEPVDVLLGDVLPRDGVHAPLDDLAVLVLDLFFWLVFGVCLGVRVGLLI
jgi:hypothetical protein